MTVRTVSIGNLTDIVKIDDDDHGIVGVSGSSSGDILVVGPIIGGLGFLLDNIGGAGGVMGPASSTDNAVPRWDGTTGIDLQDSGVLIDDSDNIVGVVALTMTGLLTLGSGATVVSSAVGELLLAAIEQGGAAIGEVLAWDGVDWAPAGPPGVEALYLENTEWMSATNT